MLRRLNLIAALAVLPLIVPLATRADDSNPKQFQLLKDELDEVTVLYGGELFTRYLTRTGYKPYLWPLVGPGGKLFTRSYPMIKGLDEERQDHHHHRSLWFTHGDVNGTDFWSETDKSGRTKHQEYLAIEGGETGKIKTRNAWVDTDGKQVCTDVRTLTFRVDGDKRIIDFDITITAGEEPVTFGDTKEGMFGVRIPTAMDVKAPGSGHILTSEGIQDKEAWGTQAKWVDYYGPLDGETVGVAILNHPGSFRYPTYWHVRDYGLFAPNPFGLHHFKNSKDVDGSYTIKPGESITFNYRVILHAGDAKSAQIAEEFERYAAEKK